jgi:hypothetical protein
MVDDPALDPGVEITNVIQRETTTPLFIRRTIPALEKEIEIETVFAGETLSLRYRLWSTLRQRDSFCGAQSGPRD